MEAQVLEQGINALALTVSADQQQLLLRYLQLIEKWNKVYNLTAIRDRLQMVSQHLLDSLTILPHVRPSALLDVGSGAGLPGIPLAIVRPDLQVTVLDSNRKKCVFLQQAVMELALTNVRVACSRIEAYRCERGFDTVVSRAFAETLALATLCVPLLAPGGVILAMKGTAPVAEQRTVVGSAFVKAIIRLHTPGLAAERHLLVMTKA
jgi:16S rRNA (guanine527-N7)-methyltransferase